MHVGPINSKNELLYYFCLLGSADYGQIRTQNQDKQNNNKIFYDSNFTMDVGFILRQYLWLQLDIVVAAGPLWLLEATLLSF